MSGEEFGPYRLLARLGAGGMGEVWRARDTRTDREVAIKRLHPTLAGDPSFVTGFRREAALAAKLNHPAIVPIHSYGEIDDQLYIEMPLLAGTDLAALIARDGPLEPARAVEVIAQVAEALDTAHAAGLVHRDVKPSNVMVQARRRGDFVHLIDFGIARQADTATTSSVGLVGTLTYMAPERFDGNADLRSDVYALAGVLFYALTGQKPFAPPADTDPDLLFYVNAHLNQPPPRASDHAPAAARAGLAGLDAVIARGMAKQPAERYPSAGELATAAHSRLEREGRQRRGPVPHRPYAARIRGTEPPRPPGHRRPSRGSRRWPAGPHRLPRRRPHRRPMRCRLCAVRGPLHRRRPSPESGTHTSSSRHRLHPQHRRRRRVPVPAAAHRPGHRGADPRARPDRSGLIWANLPGTGTGTAPVGPTGAPPAPNIERTLTGHTNWVFGLATAQLDGRTVVVSGSGDNTMRVWDLATGTPVGSPFTGHTGPVAAVATAELDGRTVVISGSWDKTVRVWDLATGTPVGSPFTGHTGPLFAVATAQLDGRTVVISASADATVRVWDLATGKPVGAPFTGHTTAVAAVATAQLDGRTVVISGSNDKHGAGVGPGHREAGRRPVHRPHRLRAGGGDRAAGRAHRGDLRRRRQHGAGVGPGHQGAGRRPVHRPHQEGGRGDDRAAAAGAPWWSPAPGTTRCGCGTWPPAHPSGPRSPATPTSCAWWPPRSSASARW